MEAAAVVQRCKAEADGVEVPAAAPMEPDNGATIHGERERSALLYSIWPPAPLVALEGERPHYRGAPPHHRIQVPAHLR